MYQVLDISYKDNINNLIEGRLVGNYIIKPTFMGMTVFFGDAEDRDKSQSRLVKFFGSTIELVCRESNTVDS